MRKLAILSSFFLLTAVTFAQLMPYVKVKAPVVVGNFPAFDHVSGTIIKDSGVNTGMISSGTNAWLWIQLNSNGVVYLFSQTSVWNQAWLDSIFATNWITTNTLGFRISIVETGKVGWVEFLSESNRMDGIGLDVVYLFSQTSVWNQAWLDSIFATNWIVTNIAADVHPSSGIMGMNGHKQLTSLPVFSEHEAGFLKLNPAGQIVVSTNWWTDTWLATNSAGQIIARNLP